MNYKYTKCIICSGQIAHFFTKRFDNYGLNEVSYWICKSCGFVGSKTHFELSDDQWQIVNKNYHVTYQGTNISPEDPQWLPRLFKQAEVIADLTNMGILPSDKQWVDFGCGDGKLSNILSEKYNLNLLKFDRFMKNDCFLNENILQNTRFGFVISTSVFEHIRRREQLDEIASLVSSDGVLGIHTLVAEEIPRTAEWFYLLPVHCAFFTNDSMQQLFDQWGYSASIYQMDSRLWFWFKKDIDNVERLINSMNARPGRENLFYHFKRGFMDYWKLDAQSVLSKTRIKER